MTSYTLAPFGGGAHIATSQHAHTTTLPAVNGAQQQQQQQLGTSTAGFAFSSSLHTPRPTAGAAAAASPHPPPSYALRLPPHPSFGASGATLSPSSALPAAAASPSSSVGSAHSRFYYKLVARVGPNRFVSLYDGTTEYVLGQTVSCPIRPAPGQTLLSPAEVDAPGASAPNTARAVGPAAAYASASGAQSARTGHTARRRATSGGGGGGGGLGGGSSAGWKGDESRGGLFVCRTPSEALSARIPSSAALCVAPRALLKCMCWGDALSYGSSTLAFAHLRPVQVYPLSLSYRCTSFGARELTAVALNETRKRMPDFNSPRHRQAAAFRQREEMGALTKRIGAMDKKLDAITRAQLS